MKRWYGIVLGWLGLMVGVMVGCGGPQEVTIQFKWMVGDKAFSCTDTYENIGTNKDKIKPLDFRFYIHNIRLVTSDDKEVALTLTQDEKWQYQNLVLLDFEDKQGTCTQGTTETNTMVQGTVEGGGSFKAIKFVLGIPFEMNHQDVTKAPSPLNVTPLFWNWQGGYRFMKIDIQAEGAEKMFRMHLGSTNCEGSDTNVTGCKRPNRVEITLNNFDPAQNAISFDLAKLFANSEVNKNTEGTALGCMSFPEDPDCNALFTNLGLKYGSDDTDPSTQTSFAVTSK